MAAKTRADVLRVNMDPALGDLALAEARDALAQGDWVPARDLLATSRALPGAVAPRADGAVADNPVPPWDRRCHRVRVLAESVANSAWVERWQILDPVNPDAALLRAQVEVIRALRAATSGAAGLQETAAEALNLCRHAAEMAPDDPTPWVVQLTLSRAADHATRSPSQPSGRDEFWRRWQEMRARDPLNRDGHHEALAYLYAAWCGSHAEMYDFAYWLAGEAPVGSPLAVLPLVAHAEVYRAKARSRTRAAQAPPVSPYEHWGRPQVTDDVARVLRSWLSSASVPHAQADLDRNYLLHAMVFSGLVDTDEARALFDAIGSHAMRAPWSFTGDAESSFLFWRERAFSGGSPRR